MADTHKAEQAYQRLLKNFRRQGLLKEAGMFLSWDSAVIMPEAGFEARGNQLAVLDGLGHEMLTDPAVGEALSEAETCPPENAFDARNLQLMRHLYRTETALPGDLVEALSKTATECEGIWRNAKADKDFSQVLPKLTEMTGLVKEQAVILGEVQGCAPYDGLLGLYQQGIKAGDIRVIFQDIRIFLQENLPLILEKQAKSGPLKSVPILSEAEQEAFCLDLVRRLGLSEASSRLDRSAHPFSTGIATDARITARYDRNNFRQGLFAVIHETGHALYDQGLPQAYALQPVGEASGTAAHESQSLMLEMQIARGTDFLHFLYKALAGRFSAAFADYEFADFKREILQVKPDFIRVEADEVTYPLHVILRFELEEALISGALKVSELPGAFNEKMQKYLGITPPDDALGCLQDVHWYSGAFGYFPFYSLGAFTAAQLMAALRAEALADPTDFSLKKLAEGDISGVLQKLRTRWHSLGNLYPFRELVQKATGKAPGTEAFKAHIQRHYLNG